MPARALHDCLVSDTKKGISGRVTSRVSPDDDLLYAGTNRGFGRVGFLCMVAKE